MTEEQKARLRVHDPSRVKAFEVGKYLVKLYDTYNGCIDTWMFDSLGESVEFMRAKANSSTWLADDDYFVFYDPQSQSIDVSVQYEARIKVNI